MTQLIATLLKGMNHYLRNADVVYCYPPRSPTHGLLTMELWGERYAKALALSLPP